MIKLLLPLSLLAIPVSASPTLPNSVCADVLDVLTEHVIEGSIEHKEAWEVYKRCLATTM